MLADQLDYIIGVDPHRDSHSLAMVQIVNGALVFESTIEANSDGYARALKLADEHACGREPSRSKEPARSVLGLRAS
jgi:transposase